MKKLLLDLLDRARVCMPDYWIMLYRYDATWDERLRVALEAVGFTGSEDGGRWTAQLGLLTVWVSNHPYGSFTSWEPVLFTKLHRPSRTTILRARRAFLQWRSSLGK